MTPAMSDPMQTLQRIDEAIAQLPEGDPQRQQLEALKMQLSAEAPSAAPMGLEQGLGQPDPYGVPSMPMAPPINPEDANAPMGPPTSPKDRDTPNVEDAPAQSSDGKSLGGKRVKRPAQELLDALMEDRLKDGEMDRQRGVPLQYMMK